jgi:hypothetical protein
MPILGITASSISGNLFNSNYESISTVTVGSGGVSNIEFSSIPSTYKHLQIRMSAEGVAGSSSGPVSVDVILNSDTGANYAYHRLYGSGSSTAADNSISRTSTLGGLINFSSSVNNIYGGSITDILDYANTNKYKVLRSLSGYDANGDGYISLISGLWQSTSAISNIKIYPLDRSYTWRQYSSFALYGIKG